MRRTGTMFYSALLLTGANLALRMVSMGFQVYLSGQIGAAGIGLLQLVLSVSMLAMTAGMGGIRTSAMYLTAEEVGSGRWQGVRRVLSACFLYSFLFSTAVALLVWFCAPLVAEAWIGDLRTLAALRIFAAFLPVVCLGGVMTGYFTAAGRIRELVAVEILEQVVSMAVTVLLLSHWASGDPGRACCAVVGGSSAASLVTLLSLLFLRSRETNRLPDPQEAPVPVAGRLLRVALPLALADDLRMGISTVENLIVPRRLGLFPQSAEPLAEYGVVCGMVFPTLMFPAAILFSLAELLVPELSRCAAGGRRKRIAYLTGRSLRVALLYGLAAGGILFTASEALGMVLFDNPLVGRQLRRFALLAPMLYVDAVTDANVKGMGQQVACVRYNTVTSFLDVVFLWLLLPRFGLDGYYLSFLVTHALNFGLSFFRLRKVTGFRPQLSVVLRALGAASLSLWVASLLPKVGGWSGVLFLAAGFCSVFFLRLVLLGVVGREDLRWIRGLVRPVDKSGQAGVS